jgi:hypothetical protein
VIAMPGSARRDLALDLPRFRRISGVAITYLEDQIQFTHIDIRRK